MHYENQFKSSSQDSHKHCKSLSLKSTLIQGTTLPGPYMCLKHPNTHIYYSVSRNITNKHPRCCSSDISKNTRSRAAGATSLFAHTSWSILAALSLHTLVPEFQWWNTTPLVPSFAEPAAIPPPTQRPQTVRTVQSVARLVPQQAIPPQVVPHPVQVVDPEFKHGRMLWLFYMPKS